MTLIALSKPLPEQQKPWSVWAWPNELLSMIDKSVAGGFSLNLDMYLQRTRLLRRIGRLDSADERAR